MDIKSHAVQQLQQPQQQQTVMLMNGNERMLTASTTTSMIATTSATASIPALSSALSSTSISSANTTTARSVTTTPKTAGLPITNTVDVVAAKTRVALKANETPINGKNNTFSTNYNSNANVSVITGNTTMTTKPTTPIHGLNPTNVSGNCQSHNNRSNGSSNNISNSNSNNQNHIGNNSKTNNISYQLQQQQIPAVDGPGPPPSNLTHIMGNIAGGAGDIRVTLGEYSSNTGVICGDNGSVDDVDLCGAGSMVADCGGATDASSLSLNLMEGNVSALCLNNTNNYAFLMQQQQRSQQQNHQQHLLQAHMPNANTANGISITPSTILGSAMLCCGFCCQPICDRYIMRVVDTSFHEGCLKCTTCTSILVHSCFARDGKLYCRIDYERLFMRNRCLGCGHKIACDELVMRTLENVFHLKCFACVVCGCLLKKGEQYVVKQGQLFCRFDYEKEVEMLQGYDFYGDDIFHAKLDGRRGPKRPRTILKTHQRRAFKASFEVSPKPCRKVRENLAKETGLSLRIVQVWFQNQRAKVKKIQKKAKQESHAKGTSDSQDSQDSDGSPATKIKDEAHSDSESLLESPYSSCGLGGDISSNSLAKLRCLRDDDNGRLYNCMETNKENCNKTNEPLLNTFLGLSYVTFQQLIGPFTQSPMINPIDRLYSMQNSYFRPDELTAVTTADDGYNNCHNREGN